MKNQYLGDIGDYGKYGMLRFLADKGVMIGVNWYLTPDDGSNDGKKTDYLNKDSDRRYDEWLYDYLKTVAFDKNKTVQLIEDAAVIPNAVYYHEVLDRDNRTYWHKKALDSLKDAELVFCDPDNGTIGKKSIHSVGSEKYIFPLEIADYYNRGQNVVYYCHRARRTDLDWMKTKLEMTRFLPDAKLYVMTYHRGTQRSYIFVLHPEEFRRFGNMLDRFERSHWGWDRVFTREFSSSEMEKKDPPGQAVAITQNNGDVVTIRAYEDGWVEVSSPRKRFRMRADDFVNRIM